ncbi:O-antigen ligase family protein [Aureimonas altamirensis]|uniref:O-antigen ligase family protein n=1 Tax=Aureimonas altamirensis TaxID=370622 RepID=UPI00068DA08A|nr:O-antigen ligase [Aureimonas altamirensis]
MRIARAWLIDPEHNRLYGVAAMTLSVFVFAYSTIFGPVSILAYYALWLPLIFVDYRKVLGSVVLAPWIVAFVAVALLSTFWSDAFSTTARASIQFATHALCALIAVNTLSVRTLTRGVVIGVVLVLVYSFLFGHYSYDALDGTYSFVGSFSSKNQLGLYASLGVYFGLAAVFILGERGLWRIGCLACVLLSAYGMVASQSATSILATAATILVTFGLRILLAFRPRHRRVILIVAILAVAALVPVLAGAGFADAVLGIFGKDSTLTGRTYLWAQGIAAGNENPLGGTGYYAYWVQGFPEAERLWYEFYIATRTGFHFHNTYIELYVELGFIGLLVMTFFLYRTLFGHLAALTRDARNPTAHLMFGLVTMFAIRSFVEIDIITPYTVGAFLMFYAAGLLVKRRRASAVAPAAAAMTARRGPHSADTEAATPAR